MASLRPLLDLAGAWRGDNRLHDPHTGRPDDAPSTLVVTPLLGGRFVRLDQTWSWRGEPQEGSLLVGYRESDGRATAHWIDSWHMGSAVMAMEGTLDDAGMLDVRGTYAAPPGPDWGWRVAVQPGRGPLRLTMWNVTPDGDEALAVEAEYSPEPSS